MAKKNDMAVALVKSEFPLIDEALLKSRIYTVRGVKVMLDADLAEIYGYETRFFNRQVKNNIDRFAEDFRFQLSEDEMQNLMCKKGMRTFNTKVLHSLLMKMLYMTVWTIKHSTCVNKFAYESAEINIEVKHLYFTKKDRMSYIDICTFVYFKIH